DFWERRHFGDLLANPEDDADGDGLSNLTEFSLSTEPLVADTDGDGLTDGDEVNAVPPLNPTNKDSDRKALSDGDEIAIYKTDPTDEDSDNDGFRDHIEVTYIWEQPHRCRRHTSRGRLDWGLRRVSFDALHLR
ncbi:MAG: hypothetical protein ACI9DF_003012, partial [Verrucomicrobiales bacterium]